MSDSNTPFDHESFLKSLPNKSGVYRMVGESGNVLYVGKARNLRSRVTSYFRASGLATKTMSLIRNTHDVQITITQSETEALLLEQSFIKKERPPFNVILRDDKSYPYIRFSAHEYPRINLHRGRRKDGDVYYGPYPSAKAVRDSISILQKLFRLRPCEDSFFKNRSRPCLQFQIHRCSGPCVRKIEPDSYANDIRSASMFLKGKSTELLTELKGSMNGAAENLQFEKAAVLRDQITQLVKVQESQNVYKSSGHVDVFGIAMDKRYVCVQGIFIRDGRLLGHRTWYPRNELGRESAEVLTEFVAQYYLGGSNREVPREVLTSVPLVDTNVLRDALSQRMGHNVEFGSHSRTHRAQWLQMVQENTDLALAAYTAKRKNVFDRFVELQEILDLEELPKRLECFDISHSSGEATVASCVVFDTNGPLKSDYRRFNINDIERGDDYAAMAQAITRHYSRIKMGDGKLPDVLIIDGGRGQIGRVHRVLLDLQIDEVNVLGISKGPGRKDGLETIWTTAKSKVETQPNSGAMHLLQHIRDEAHRFAITGHRNRRQRQRRRSELDDIPGIGPTRKRELLTHFGSTASIKGASAEELTKVPGISRKLADEIYGIFHVS